MTRKKLGGLSQRAKVLKKKLCKKKELKKLMKENYY